MPRPKRTRVASTRTTAKAHGPVVASGPPEQPKPAQSSSDLYDVSDREKAKVERKRRSTRSKPTSASQQLQLLETARQRRDSAMDRLENMMSTPSNEAGEPADESDLSVELGRRVAGTPQHRRMADFSGLDLDDADFDDLNTTFNTAGPASAQRSAETSTMSASVFRRRPRAGSFLSREDGYIRPSSRGGPNTPGLSSTFNIGVFKRRAREPSILGTAQKPRSQRSEPEPEPPSSQPEDEDEDEDEAIEEDAFAPEETSTPLRRSKRRSGQTDASRASPQASSSVKTRKRKSSKGHERRARSSPFQDNGDGPVEGPASPQSEPDLPPLPSTPPRGLSRPRTPVMDEELMAPPMSSGSSAGDPEEGWPPLQLLGRGRPPRRAASALQRRTATSQDNLSDMSSPPSLTYSPNYRDASSPPPPPPPRQASKPRRRAASRPENVQVTTADLAGLLPRRRARNARVGSDGYDDEESDAEVDASGLGNDDDELSYLDVRTRRRLGRSASRGAGARAKSKQRSGSGGSKAKQPQTPVVKSRSKRTTITYGRVSDNENQEEGEEEEDDVLGSTGAGGEGVGPEDSQAMVTRVGDELKRAARKFQEVDKWQLDYEEMTQSSSPRDAR
ncbi:hypothetical protein GGS23DRAFT_586258 [Durotheca rogersii]|uniref:uncharacterized protein n=1 Tax=Durotheca rogersii TaxID=419775 RepID=UPI00221FC362|nr:uncharacterized protein GGS23DRAFT_586258 [Durotheca rogersii]KAI5859404.1 hypothetical protein GGS23DRAFT_586258 [Durotheca rogersii]